MIILAVPEGLDEKFPSIDYWTSVWLINRTNRWRTNSVL